MSQLMERVTRLVVAHRAGQPSPYSDAAQPSAANSNGPPAKKPQSAIVAAWKPIGLDALTTTPPARRWLLRHPTRDWNPCAPGQGDGLLPLGKAGVLAAEGGAGKTQALVQLGISVITGRRWLDHFDIGDDARGRRVLLALAEEDAEEVQRRTFEVVRAMRLRPDERERVAERLTVLPLAGHSVALLRREGLGSLVETSDLADLRKLLAAGEPWALVALDPLSRWAGPDAEKDNEAATRTVQALESLTAASGNPTVLAAAHSSKLARREGKVDTRGVSGITDGLRWEGTLRVADAEVYFRQAKSNYSRPMPESREVELVRDSEGVLRAMSDGEREHREDLAREAHQGRSNDALERDVQRLVTAAREKGPAVSKAQLIAWAGMGSAAGRLALAESVTRGLIANLGSSREPRLCVCNPPVPPESASPRERTAATQGVADSSPRESARVRKSATARRAAS